MVATARPEDINGGRLETSDLGDGHLVDLGTSSRPVSTSRLTFCSSENA